MLRFEVKKIVFYLIVIFLSFYIVKRATNCYKRVLLDDNILSFEHNIVEPYKGEDAWNFDMPFNRNFSAFNFYLAQIDASWIDVLIILDVFFPTKRQRFFVEAGGADGELFANTVYLEKFKSWNGVLIEADPYYFEQLLYKRRKVYAVKVCLSISNSSYIANFQHEGVPTRRDGKIKKSLNIGNGRVLYNEMGHSGFGKDFKDPPDTERFGEVLSLSCFPLSSVLGKLNVTNVDVLFLDVEGQELGILKTIPFQKILVHVIVVEYDGRMDYLKQIREFLKSVGYELHNTYHSAWTLGDAVFVQKGNYSMLAIKNVSLFQMRQILFSGTDSAFKINKIS